MSVPPHTQELQTDFGSEAEELASQDPSLPAVPLSAMPSSEVGDETNNLARNEEHEIVLSNGQRLLGLDFDLNALNDRTNDLEISKPVRLDGQPMGNARLTIDPQSQLYVSSEDLSRLLPEELFAGLDTGTNFIGFDDLRAGGVSIRYDPLADVIEIVP